MIVADRRPELAPPFHAHRPPSNRPPACSPTKHLFPPSYLTHRRCRPVAPQTFRSRSGQLKYEYMLLVFVLLAGYAGPVETLGRVAPHLFLSIEDYMWLHISLVTTVDRAAASSASESSFLSSGGWFCFKRIAACNR